VSRRNAEKELWREILAVAGLDLDELASEIEALEGAAEGDAYYLAGGLHAQAQLELAKAQTLAGVRAIAGLADDARHQAACALAGEDVPRRAACFFDPAHGRSDRAVAFAPSGGAMERVPACDECAEAVEAGHAPALRRVKRDGRSVPYWRDPAHIGYFGRTGTTVSDLLVVEEPTRRRTESGIGLFDLLDDWISPV
jgi:hypothetical protein